MEIFAPVSVQISCKLASFGDFKSNSNIGKKNLVGHKTFVNALAVTFFS